MPKKINKYSFFLKLTFIILFISIWFSLDTNFENILIFNSYFTLTNLILVLRCLAPFALFFLIYILLLKEDKIRDFISFNKILNFLAYIFFSYLVLQIISHLTSGNKLIFLYYFFPSFFLLLYLNFAVRNNLLDFSFYISLGILIILFIIFGALSLKHFFTSGDLHFYGTFPNVYKSILTVSTNVVRSSGLSRTALLIYIPLFLYLLISPTSKFKLIINFFLIFIILLTQSRLTNIYWSLLIIFSSIFYFRNNEFFKYVKKVIIILIIPFLITGAIISSKYYLLYNKIILTDSKNKIIGIKIFDHPKLSFIKEGFEYKISTKNNVDDKVDDIIIVREIDPLTYSSGRVDYWKKILNRNNRQLIGNGYLGDRYLLENDNASNLIFYTYASSGLLGSILIIFLVIRCFFICMDLIFFEKINLNKKNLIPISSIFYLGFIVFRGIGENSFAVFSIDQIIFLQSFIIVEIFRLKLKRNEKK